MDPKQHHTHTTPHPHNNVWRGLPVQEHQCILVTVHLVRDSRVGRLQMDDCLTETKDLLVKLLLLLDDLLPSIDGPFKLVYDGIVGGVSPSGPLQTL